MMRRIFFVVMEKGFNYDFFFVLIRNGESDEIRLY